MECFCEKCNTYFKIKGFKTLELLTGGTQCPNCGKNLTKIIIHKKRGGI